MFVKEMLGHTFDIQILDTISVVVILVYIDVKELKKVYGWGKRESCI